MRWLNDVWFRIRAVFTPSRMDRELEDEMAFHREMETQKLVDEGMNPDLAVQEAKRRFGSQPRERERTRESWGIGMIRDFFADVFHTFRQLKRNKMFTSVSVMTLALGIGATIALATVVHGIMLRPLPYPDEDELVVYWSDYNWRGSEFDFSKNIVTAFDGIAAYSPDAFPVQTDLGSTMLPVTETSAEFFDVLDVSPMMGRTFLPGDDRPGSELIMVISHGLWQTQFGGDPDILGRRVSLAGRSRTVVGVMPPGFLLPNSGVPSLDAAHPGSIDPELSGERLPKHRGPASGRRFARATRRRHRRARRGPGGKLQLPHALGQKCQPRVDSVAEVRTRRR